MPIHPDWRELYHSFIEQYGEEKGKSVFYAYCEKHSIDYTKPKPKKESFSWAGSIKEMPGVDNLIRSPFSMPRQYITKIFLGEHSLFSKLANAIKDIIFIASAKLFRNFFIGHFTVILDEKRIFFRRPMSKTTTISISRNHTGPFSLHHIPFRVSSQKLRDIIGRIYPKLIRDFSSFFQIKSVSDFVKSTGYPNLRKFLRNLFHPVFFRGGNMIAKGVRSLSGEANRTICRKKPCKPDNSLPEFLVTFQSSHPEKSRGLSNLNIRGE